MVEDFCSRPVTAKVPVQSQARLFGTYGRQNGTGTVQPST